MILKLLIIHSLIGKCLTGTITGFLFLSKKITVVVDDKLLEELIKWLESLLSAGAISYYTYLAWLALFGFLLYQWPRTPRVEMHLVPVSVNMDQYGNIHRGIIDLNDPSGVALRALYSRVPIWEVLITIPGLLPRQYTCLCTTIPLDGNEWENILDPWAAEFAQVEVFFPWPNIDIWSRMQAQGSLVVYTGHNRYYRVITPEFYPAHHGMRVVGFEVVLESVQRRVGNLEQNLF
jgi:hypothetical protein